MTESTAESTAELTADSQRTLVQSLQSGAGFPHPCGDIEHIETHISHVLLTGDYAYKIKKAVNLGFLDFSTLARRRHFCEEEIRLNSRLAPAIYLEAVPIGGTAREPVVAGTGEAIEYAVKMRQFDHTLLLSRLASRGDIEPRLMDEIAARVAQFHGDAAVADPASPFGGAEAVLDPCLENFRQLRPLLAEPDDRARLDRLEQWTTERFQALQSRLERRRREGFIRECHGDMHLGNMALVDGRVLIFDGIEFNHNLRWIDVMSEVAFLAMDLDDRGLPGCAHRLLNLYLEHTGDYPGLEVLDFYRVYRALVRAKVCALRLAQRPPANERSRIEAECHDYLTLAERYTVSGSPALVLTHGLSGSGKSTIADRVVERFGAIRLRSDVERKRCHQLEPGERTGAGLDQGIYGGDATRATYRRLAALAEAVLAAGFPVIADATFLQGWQRALFTDLAERTGVPLRILDIEVSMPTLRRWIEARNAAGDDPSDADFSVVEHQAAHREPLTPTERALARTVQAEDPQLDAALADVLASAPAGRG